MEYIIIPTEDLKAFDEYWETRRKSNDGTQAVLHKEIYDKYFPEEDVEVEAKPKMLKASPRMAMMAMPMAEPTPSLEECPYPVVSGDDINNMPEFNADESTIK